MPAELLIAQTLLPGHPDARADVLADALVDAAFAHHPEAECDLAVHLRGSCLSVSGTWPSAIDVETVAREHFPEAEIRLHPIATVRGIGPHALAIGYAIDEPGTNDLPPEFWLARQIALRLKNHPGELVVLLESDGQPRRLAGLSCSLGTESPSLSLEKQVRAVVQDELAHLARRVPGFESSLPESIALHRFVSPAQAGSNRWPVAGVYGPRVASAGPGVHGKDLAHPGRALSILARRLARAVVRAGVAHECRATLSRIPGQDDAMIVALVGDGQRLDPSRWGDLIDRSLPNLTRRYRGKVSLAEITRQGQFLREDWPWERICLDG